MPDLLFWNKPVHPYKVLHVNQSVSTDRFLVSLARFFNYFLINTFTNKLNRLKEGGSYEEHFTPSVR